MTHQTALQPWLPTAALTALCLVTVAPWNPLAAQDHHGHAAAGASSYVGLEDREIKALSPEELKGLLEGEGLGFALAAELNGVAGPLHALELEEALRLSASQKSAIQELFTSMRETTARLGGEVVELERTLDRRFQHRHLDQETLRELTTRIALLRGEIRATHLQAHLDVDALLSQEQRDAYPILRGYHAGDDHSSGPAHSHPPAG